MAKRKQLGAILHKNGVTFRVWAPFAERVAVTGSFNGWQHAPMEREDNGLWALEIKDAEAGQEYKYVIKNGDQELYKNDPRSLQLTTTGGNSVIADNDFEWGETEFTAPNMNEQVIYELHVGTFNRADPAMPGTFYDAIRKLDYLKDLGINMVELMPINPMPGDRGWGYAPNYIYAVETLYGGRRGLLEFVKEAHKRGIGVILDVVYNHFGPDGGLDMWRFDGWGENDKGGIYFYNDWRSSTPWGETRPDYGRPEVQDYILDNVTLWLADFRLDGLRLDSTIYMRNVKGYDNDPGNDLPEAWSLMQRLNELAHKINPHALTIAEDSGGNSYATEAIGFGGAGFGSQWENNFPHVLRSVLEPTNDQDRNLSALEDQLKRRFNTDVFKRIVYSDSHDTAANGGARLSEEIAPGEATSLYARKRNLLASLLTLTAPGIPMLFQGQEFNEGGSFNDWQVLEWEKAERFGGLVQAHKHLISLRKNAGGVSRGLAGQNISIVHNDPINHVMAWHRWMDGGPGDDVVIIANFSNQTLQDYQLHLPRDGAWKVRFNSSWSGYSPDFKEVELSSTEAQNSQATVNLAPYSAIILSQD
jgi:1,4-alpha-glucan branching enzyme